MECVKHLRRCFRTSTKRIATSKTGRIDKAKGIVKAGGEKCITEVNRILKRVWDSGRDFDEECIFEIHNAINVIPRHVFGDHNLWIGNNPLCDGTPKDKEVNQVDYLETWNFVTEIETAISRLSENAKSLLFNMDTNLVGSMSMSEEKLMVRKEDKEADQPAMDKAMYDKKLEKHNKEVKEKMENRDKEEKPTRGKKTNLNGKF